MRRYSRQYRSGFFSLFYFNFIIHSLQTARETLERAIRAVNSNKLWDAEVIYGLLLTESLFVACSNEALPAGDTDSLFVLLRHRSKVLIQAD
jgi:hypothetical protein